MRAPLALAALLGLSACGHVSIVTNDPSARIYVDGAYVGKGIADFGARTGFPQTMEITVKGPTAKVQREVKREFTVTTFFLGAFTYMTGWLWGWQYPENVMVMLPDRGGAEAGSGWDEVASPWDAPPPGWQPKAAPAPAR